MPDRIVQFREKVEAQPENPLFRFSLAQAYMDAGQPSEAIPHLERCLAGRPDWMMAAILLGDAYRTSGDNAKARSTWEAALQLAVVQQHETPEAEIRDRLADL
ncbi:MAG: tetratricopeptide repeat protein [Opitutales bacterium]